MVRVRVLKEQIGTTGPRPILRCFICGSEFSANRGDYFAAHPEYIFECCGEPMTLCIRRVTYEAVIEYSVDPAIPEEERDDFYEYFDDDFDDGSDIDDDD